MPVETVLGPVEASQLGQTLMHEHIFVRSEAAYTSFPHLWNEERWVPEAVARLQEVAALGVRTLVDLTVMGLGRDVRLVQRIAQQVPQLNIIVATGIYIYSDDEMPRALRGLSADQLAELFVRDIRQGIQGTEVKAAIIKCVTDEPGVTPQVEKVLRAAARAHLQTGVPISTHTHSWTRRGLDQQRIFKEEGVDLSRVVIGHSGDTDDYDYLVQLMENGSYIGMDRFGIYPVPAASHFPTFEKRVEVVAELCRRGYAERMVLSHDASVYIDWFPTDLLRAAQPRWHYCHIHREVLPALRERGVSERQIEQMLVENPRRIFAGP
ncbi:MAG TPA: phosphotriesterase-related protein [Dehalococcoidia bacterium]|nr:phosphotriesterase-related protein [Dehalococcoidia bacterium]